jgi:HEAT repeat protein
MIQLMLLMVCLAGEDDAAIARLRRQLGPRLGHLGAISKAGQLGPKGRPLVPTLLRLLETAKESRVRADIALALCRIGPEGDALADERSPLVAGLLRALNRETGYAPCVRLVQALRRTVRPTPAVHAALARALRKHSVVGELLADCDSSTTLAVLRLAFSGERPEEAARALPLAIKLGPQARPLLPALVRLLQHEGRAVRGNAARAILAARVPSLVPKADAVLAELVEGLDDNEMSHAPGINAPLDEQSAPLPRTALALAVLLRSPNSLVRYRAAQALSLVPASASISAPLLEAALGDEDREVRVMAASALVKLGRPTRAVRVLIAHLHENKGVPRLEIDWLSPDAQWAAPVFHRYLRETPPSARANIALALWRVGRARSDGPRTHDPREEALDALGGLVNSPDESIARRANFTIRRIGPPAARLWPRLVRLVKTRADEVLLDDAICTLGSLGPGAARAEPALVRLLDHDSITLRLQAAVALNAIRPGHRHALATILAVVRRHPDYAGEACRALRQMGPHARRAVPWLVRMLRSGVNKDASLALWAIDPTAARKAGAW